MIKSKAVNSAFYLYTFTYNIIPCFFMWEFHSFIYFKQFHIIVNKLCRVLNKAKIVF